MPEPTPPAARTGSTPVDTLEPASKARLHTPTRRLPHVLATVGPASVLSCLPGRHSGTFVTPAARRSFLITLAILALLSLASTFGVLAWNNPMPMGTDGFWRIAEMRSRALVVIAVVALCHAVASVSFHTVTANRLITPSIMGFESLYVLLNTAVIFFVGARGILAFHGPVQFFTQAALMVAASGALYGWLLRGRSGDIHTMLLVGIVLGGGLGALSTFMQRMLDPSTFDILTARVMGNISNADESVLPFAIPLALVAAGALMAMSIRLNVLALGAPTATNVGVHHNRTAILVLALISVLMACTTSLVGPMTFLGFLIATLAYQLTDTFDHRAIFPIAILVGYVILSGSYFILRHVFSAQGAVTVIIELVGGLAFLITVIRKGRL